MWLYIEVEQLLTEHSVFEERRYRSNLRDEKKRSCTSRTYHTNLVIHHVTRFHDIEWKKSGLTYKVLGKPI